MNASDAYSSCPLFAFCWSVFGSEESLIFRARRKNVWSYYLFLPFFLNELYMK